MVDRVLVNIKDNLYFFVNIRIKNEGGFVLMIIVRFLFEVFVVWKKNLFIYIFCL